jgi:hypothetical protein
VGPLKRQWSASTFEEAKDEIRRRNYQEGFEIGFAASLLGAEPPWLERHAKLHAPVADPVISEMLGAVGLAEREFNKGLDAGNAIAWALPLSARQPLLLIGLNALGAEGFTTDRGTRDVLSLRTRRRLACHAPVDLVRPHAVPVESVPEWMEALALAKTKREFGSVESIEQNK